jgi:MSHA biogenesis protein MshG
MFAYKGRTNSGNAVHGQIEAGSPDSAAGLLLERGITPINIVAAKAEHEKFLDRLFGKLKQKRPDLDDLIMLNRQLYSLIKAGVPLNRAINSLMETTHNAMLSSALGTLVSTLDAGFELSAAMAQHPKVFPFMMVSMIKVGETTGQLETSFLRVSTMLEYQKETRNRIKSALRYPSFVLVAIVVAVIILNIFVIPSFANVFERFGAELPLPTRILIGTSSFTVHYWPYLLAVTAAAVVALRSYVKTAAGAFTWGRLKLRIPVIGSIIHRASLARFARSLATTARSGIAVVQGLNIVIHSEENPYIGAAIDVMRSTVERGDTLLRSAAACGLFTPVVLQMISVGEETGALDTMLLEVADFYEREVDYELKNISAAIEPLLIIFIGGIVLVLALGIFLPMWDLSSVAFHHH